MTAMTMPAKSVPADRIVSGRRRVIVCVALRSKYNIMLNIFHDNIVSLQ